MTDERLKVLWREEKRLQRLSIRAHYREDLAAIARIRKEYSEVFEELKALCRQKGLIR